jgi:hypothetical protein
MVYIAATEAGWVVHHLGKPAEPVERWSSQRAQRRPGVAGHTLALRVVACKRTPERFTIVTAERS